MPVCLTQQVSWPFGEVGQVFYCSTNCSQAYSSFSSMHSAHHVLLLDEEFEDCTSHSKAILRLVSVRYEAAASRR